MTEKRKGLGRGLEALLSADQSETARSSALALDCLQPGKYQPRTHMDPGSLEELAASIKSQGIMQPILVRPIGKGGTEGNKGKERYEIVAGERRWRAAQIAKLTEVPVLIRNIPDEAALAMSLIENIQREDLNPLEEAAGIQRLINEFGMTHQQAADAVGRSRPAASNLLRLLQLATPVQNLLMAGDIDMGHARALLPLAKANQIQLANILVSKRLSVRETEQLVTRELNPPTLRTAPQKGKDVLGLEDSLTGSFGTPVKISVGRKGIGKLAIHFSSLEHLDGILARLGVTNKN